MGPGFDILDWEENMNRVAMGVIGAVILVVVAGGAFYGGMKVGQNQVIANPMQYLQQARVQGGQFPGQGGDVPRFRGTPEPGQQGFGRIGGAFDTIQSIEGNEVLVSREDGIVRIITTDTTLIQKYTSVGVDELEPGEQVIVSGSENEDGSITARSIRSLAGMQFDVSDQPSTQP
jgi:hypothetical protein